MAQAGDLAADAAVADDPNGAAVQVERLEAVKAIVGPPLLGPVALHARQPSPERQDAQQHELAHLRRRRAAQRRHLDPAAQQRMVGDMVDPGVVELHPAQTGRGFGVG